MKTIRLDIAYKGTNYCGWQIQPNGISVEQKLREALVSCGADYTKFAGSGRTDAGVHAACQTASFLTNSSIPPERFSYALNAKLPKDIRVLESSLAPEGFHARYSAKSKHYRYQIDTAQVQSPFTAEYSWHYTPLYDKQVLARACTTLSGTHDYKAYKASGSCVKNTVRTVSIAQPEYTGSLITLNFYGTGFLYNMVRILAGTLMQTASGKIDHARLVRSLEQGDRKDSGFTAPPQGLRLERVYYDNSLDKYLIMP